MQADPGMNLTVSRVGRAMMPWSGAPGLPAGGDGAGRQPTDNAMLASDGTDGPVTVATVERCAVPPTSGTERSLGDKRRYVW